MYTFNVDDDYSDNALMALDSFQQLLDFRLPKRKNSYLDMTTKSQNMRKSTKIPTIFLSAPRLVFLQNFSNVATERNRYEWWEIFFWAPLIKDSCFSKCRMRIGQQILTGGTGHKDQKYFRSFPLDLCLSCFVYYEHILAFCYHSTSF